MARHLVIVLEDKTVFDGWVEEGFDWDFTDGPQVCSVAALNAVVTDPPEGTEEPEEPEEPGTEPPANQDLVDATSPDQTVPEVEVPNPDVDNGLVEVTPEPPEGNPDLTPEVDQGTDQGLVDATTPDQTVPTLPQAPDQSVPSVPSGTDNELVEATPPPPAGNPDLTPEVDQGTDQGLVEATPPVEEVPNPDVDNSLVEEVPTPAEEDPWLYAIEQVNQPNRVVDFTAKKGLVLTDEQAIDEGFTFRCAQISSLDGYVRREFSKTFPTYAGPLNCTLEDLYGDGVPANNETMLKTLSFVVSPQSVVADAASTRTTKKK